jgi:uncharacterized protein YehS (DUF1456 family)
MVSVIEDMNNGCAVEKYNDDIATILSVCYAMNVDERKLHVWIQKEYEEGLKRERDFSAVSTLENICV